MKIRDFEIRYVSHVCFILASPGGGVIVTDPLFAKGFSWKQHVERYLSRPDISAQDIKRCDAVFVSHIHGDHFDPDAVETIMKNTGAVVWAPADTIDALRDRGAPEAQVAAISEGQELSAADIKATAMAGYDSSYDEQGRPNKFSLLLEAGSTRVLYSGDCHEAPPAMKGKHVDAVFSWPHPDDAKLAAFGAAFKADRYVLMHGDRFDPGDFFCNMDYEAEKRRVARLLPDMEVVIPERISSVE